MIVLTVTPFLIHKCYLGNFRQPFCDIFNHKIVTIKLIIIQTVCLKFINKRVRIILQ